MKFGTKEIKVMWIIDSDALKKARFESGLSLKKLSVLVGVTSSYLWSLENGERTRCSDDVYQKILKALQQ